MKVEITATVDGKLIGTAIFEDGKITSATFGEGMTHVVDVTEFRQMSALSAALNKAVTAYKSALDMATMPMPKATPPRTITVGDTVTEPGSYYALAPIAVKSNKANRIISDIFMCRDEATIDALLEAVSGIKLPEPPAPADAETAPNGGTA